jgi:hypothetical protein
LVIEGSGKKPMTFSVSTSTSVLAKGASTKTKQKKEAGAAGVSITDVVHVGDQVQVQYTGTDAAMQAAQVRVTHQGPNVKKN